MYINIISSYRNIVAIADKELIGKQFEEGKKFLDVKESFYKGEEEPKEKEEVKQIIVDWAAEDATFNIVGEKSVQTALEVGLITQEAIGKVNGIPFTLVLL